MRDMVDGSSGKGVVLVACIACIIRFDAAARRETFFVAGSFCAAYALEVLLAWMKKPWRRIRAKKRP